MSKESQSASWTLSLVWYNLEIWKFNYWGSLDTNKFNIQDALILEQYFLLNKEFNLNTLRVVNAGSSKGDAVFVYDLTYKTLYYQAKSKIELKEY